MLEYVQDNILIIFCYWGERMVELKMKENYTIDYICNLPEGERAELIDGQIYYMAPPSRKHQEIAAKLYRKIADYIESIGS